MLEDLLWLLGGQAQVTDKLNIAGTLNYSTRKRVSQTGSGTFEILYYLPRSIDVKNLPFENPQTGENAYYREVDHPLWVMNNEERNDDRFRVFGTVNATYDFTDNLSLNYRVGYDSEADNEFDYKNNGGFSNPFGDLDTTFDKEVVVDQSLILNTSFKLTDKIGLDTTLGINSSLRQGVGQSADYREQIVHGFARPDNYKERADGDYYEFTQNYAGAYGQFEFSYDSSLYLTLSGRNDWSSTLEPDRNQIFYPGVSLSFIPTSAFDFGSRSINYLKLRGAYASSSGFPDRYRTRNNLTINPQSWITSAGDDIITNRLPSRLARPNLKPELHKEVEVGVEGSFFDNRVTLDASAYKRISNNQVLTRSLDGSTGFTSTLINVGRIDTEGLEIELAVDLIENDNFRWNFKNIFTAYETTVVKLGGDEDEIPLGGRRFAIEGASLNVLRDEYALRDQEGNLLINPDTGIIITSDTASGYDDRILGNADPDFTLSNINSLSYKGLTLMAQLEYTHGGEDFSNTAVDLMRRGVTKDTENREGSFIFPGVYGDTQTGLPILDANGQTIPNTSQISGTRVGYRNYYDVQEFAVFDTSVFRIREIALGYSMNRRKFKNLPFESIAFTLSGRNIFYDAPGFPEHTNIDPAVSTGTASTIPTTKRYSMRLAITF